MKQLLLLAEEDTSEWVRVTAKCISNLILSQHEQLIEPLNIEDSFFKQLIESISNSFLLSFYGF